jgi:hypothetical protein
VKALLPSRKIIFCEKPFSGSSLPGKCSNWVLFIVFLVRITSVRIFVLSFYKKPHVRRERYDKKRLLYPLFL